MNQFKNKVLYIESNEMLEEVRALIEGSGEKVDFVTFYLSENLRSNYLYYDDFFKLFCIAPKDGYDSKITLEEFKELLKK